MKIFIESICIRIIRRCNLRCLHCWASSSPSAEGRLDPDLVVEFVKEMQEIGLRHVSISGGEPLLYAVLQELINRFLNLGLYVTVTTNGAFGRRRDERLSEIICAAQNRRLRVRVSVDGIESTHEAIRGLGTFNKTIHTISKIKKEAGWVGVNTVAVNMSESSVRQLCALMADLDVNHWAVMTPLPKGHNISCQDTIDEINRRIVVFREEAGMIGLGDRLSVWDYWTRDRGHLIVDANGDVILPGRIESRDVIVGKYSERMKQKVTSAIIADLRDNSKAFYEWSPW